MSNDSHEPSTSSSSTNDVSSMSTDTDSSQEASAGPLGCCRWLSSSSSIIIIIIILRFHASVTPVLLSVSNGHVLLNWLSVRTEVRVFEGIFKTSITLIAFVAAPSCHLDVEWFEFIYIIKTNGEYIFKVFNCFVFWERESLISGCSLN